MKKFMLIAAAASAMVAVAEVKSANTVGYQTKVLREGKEMITPTFQEVGGERGVWLSDLIPAGYEYNRDFWYGYGCDFTVTLRDQNGGIAVDEKEREMKFIYKRTFDGDSWYGSGLTEEDDESVQFWLNDGPWEFDGLPLTPHTEGSDLWVSAGLGLWIEVQGHNMDDDKVYTLVYSGQVNIKPCTLVFREGKNPMGNMFPVAIRLSSLTPTGYLYNRDYWYSYGSDIKFIIRGADGGTEERNGKQLSFLWKQNFDGDSWYASGLTEEDDESVQFWLNDGHWEFDGLPITVGGEGDELFQAGQGLWIEAPYHNMDDDKEYSVTFTCPVQD